MRIGVICIAMIFILVFVSSCSTTKQNGFSYRPAHAGPDMAATGYEDLASGEIPAPTVSMPGTEVSMGLINPVEEKTMAADMAKIVEQQMLINSSVEKVEARKLVHDMAVAYSSEKDITLTPKQLRKLDKFAVKMERKQQKQADVDWGPQNNLEIFLLAAAGVGLVVGFFSSFGWFIFLVAALVYLYLKLLKN
jgi:hypothetical protein